MTTTYQTALHAAKQLGVAVLDARCLLLFVLGRSSVEQAYLLAHPEASLQLKQQERFIELCKKRAQGVPLAYLTGEREFFGLSLQVTPDVLVPRPETEHLVEWALELLQGCSTKPWVLDLGTGSGAIALALARHAPNARVFAADVSPAALAVGAGNAQRLGLAVEFRLSNWLDAFDSEQERFELIVSNPPYIKEGDVHLADLEHEPQLALTSGPDGLDALRHLIHTAPAYLKPGGYLLLEHGFDQALQVQLLFEQAGWQHIETRLDLAGLARCTGGQWI